MLDRRRLLTHAGMAGPKHLIEFDPSTASQVHCQGGSQLLAQSWLFDRLTGEVQP
jgi:hypothetical protein